MHMLKDALSQTPVSRDRGDNRARQPKTAFVLSLILGMIRGNILVVACVCLDLTEFRD